MQSLVLRPFGMVRDSSVHMLPLKSPKMYSESSELHTSRLLTYKVLCLLRQRACLSGAGYLG